MANMSPVKKFPLARITAIWDNGSISQYPETIRVPMNDGNVVNYRLDEERQPHPAFLFAMALLKKLPKGSYQYKGKR